MRLTLACGRYDRTQALIDDRVRIEGVEELNYLALRPGETFWRMLNHEEFDASEMSLSSYSILRSEGTPFVLGMSELRFLHLYLAYKERELYISVGEKH